MDTRPIGIFDSGLGGLTVVKEFLRALPGEDIIYFGDTGRVPYGSRSNETIAKYAAQDARFLLKYDVKLIIAACGTVSSVAGDMGENLPVPYIGVVGPAVRRAANVTRNGRIGVIGTQATIASGSYKNELEKLDSSIRTYVESCPLFVPLVEGGFIRRDETITILTAQRYLERLKKAQVDTLILGCTHYPIISPIIQEIMGKDVTLVNAGHEAAATAAELLCKNGLLSGKIHNGDCRFYVSDITQEFSKVAGILLRSTRPLDVQLMNKVDRY